MSAGALWKTEILTAFLEVSERSLFESVDNRTIMTKLIEKLIISFDVVIFINLDL